MKRRIFGNMCLVALTVILLTSGLITVVYFNKLEERVKYEIKSEAGYIETAIMLSGDDYLTKVEEYETRITVINSDGFVVYDSVALDETTLENHLDRPEVQAALENGTGEAVRMSDTFAEKTYYHALKLQDGRILRLSSTINTVYAELIALIPWFLLISLFVVALSMVLANYLTKRIVAPINNLDLENPEDNTVYDEITPLLSKTSKQNEIIAKQISEVQQKQQEFSMITENMSEGFLIVDTKTDILSYNTSAMEILGVKTSAENKSVLTLNRSEGFRQAVDLALSGQHNEQILEIHKRIYNIIANPVNREAKIVGAVIVILDVTEKAERENLRREFTANVSHELKTPLTSISGFAEIIKNHIAKPEDVPHFAEKIYMEAGHLISLVGDIIKLSQLDENVGITDNEPVDLYFIAKDVIERLKDIAEQSNITIGLSGKQTFVNGSRRILDEMIYNLCDNAIKYNKVGGTVTVLVDSNALLKKVVVADTGIGIPNSQKDRVFERFYRVDKSHSKEINGTGLGLAIVKHGAAYHGAQVALESTEGVGTTVSIVWESNI